MNEWYFRGNIVQLWQLGIYRIFKKPILYWSFSSSSGKAKEGTALSFGDGRCHFSTED